ncbi:MAG: HlyD family efflux transporter periplasmic adaptor subunit [Bacteroidetes bacterium]|nr:HlyD family efflux transporter periplasmic adaptor subunit [Bacteroidota bacterium]
MNRVYIFIALILLVACNKSKDRSDAYGNFEAVETTISSEANGKLIKLNLEEGQSIKAGLPVGIIDTVDTQLKLEQLEAQIKSINAKSDNLKAQIAVVEQQKENLLIDKQRITGLLKDKAATPKQMDDIKGAIDVADKQKQSFEVQYKGVNDDVAVVRKQIEQLKENIRRCHLINPVDGVVLAKYAEAYEMMTMGKAIYKIADISSLDLKVFVSGKQLPDVKIGKEASVLVDQSDGTMKKLTGTISWISDQAEFTPKIIQTRDERVNLVYAVKIKVKNDGSIKIGMPAEVNF